MCSPLISHVITDGFKEFSILHLKIVVEFSTKFKSLGMNRIFGFAEERLKVELRSNQRYSTLDITRSRKKAVIAFDRVTIVPGMLFVSTIVISLSGIYKNK